MNRLIGYAAVSALTLSAACLHHRHHQSFNLPQAKREFLLDAPENAQKRPKAEVQERLGDSNKNASTPSALLVLAGGTDLRLPPDAFSSSGTAVFAVEKQHSDAILLRRYPNLMLAAPLRLENSREPSPAGYLRHPPITEEQIRTRTRSFADDCGMAWKGEQCLDGGSLRLEPLFRGYVFTMDGGKGKCTLIRTDEELSAAAAAILTPPHGEKPVSLQELRDLQRSWEQGLDTQAELDYLKPFRNLDK